MTVQQAMLAAGDRPMTVTVDPESTGGNVPNGSQVYGVCQALVENSIGSVTYQWTRLAGGSQQILPTAATSQLTNFASDGTDVNYGDVFVCTVTDARGPVQSSNSVGVSVQHGLPP